MKSAIVALCLVACVYAQTPNQAAKVLQNVYESKPSGDFEYAYETDNGIKGQAQGNVKVIDKDTVALEVKGSNSYKSPEGEYFELSFVANENGYQPQGAHLPTPPPPQPIPEYIQKSLAYIAAHPYVEKKL